MRKVTVPGLARLPTFCHAVEAGGFLHVSGTLGTVGDSFELAPGGTGPETAQALRNVERILTTCGASLGQLVKVNVFLADIRDFPAMNEAYLAVIGDDPPARITVGRADLAMGARVELDAVAWLGGSGTR